LNRHAEMMKPRDHKSRGFLFVLCAFISAKTARNRAVLLQQGRFLNLPLTLYQDAGAYVAECNNA
jgi:hypothetical protein